MDEKQKKALELLKKEVSKIENQENKWVAMDTSESWAWAEFIDTGLSNSILTKVRDEVSVFSKMPAPIMMPTSTFEIPMEWVDPIFSYTQENTAGPGTEYWATTAWSDKLSLTARKLSAIIYLSWELDEDSIIAIRPYIEDKLSKAMVETIDKLLINGDMTTTATWNVNSDDWAPTSWLYYLSQDWFRKSAIQNSKTVNAWTLDSADFRNTRKKMGRKWLNPEKLLWIFGPDVYYQLLNMSQVETIEKFGGSATMVNGVLKYIDGIELMTNWDMPLTEADGKCSATSANNTLWTWILVYKPDIITWFRRQLKINVEYLPGLDQFRISAHIRFAQKVKEADSVAALINVTV